MKKVIFVATLLLTTLLPIRAQRDMEALAAALDTIVREYHIQYDSLTSTIVSEIFEKNNKSAYLATRIANAYYKYSVDKKSNLYNTQGTHKKRNFYVNDTVKAFKYINMAIRIDPKYGDAYALASNILDYDGQTSAARSWLRRGMVANPKDTTLFIADARIVARDDIVAAENILQRCQTMTPDFQVPLHMARIYEEIDVTGVQYRREVAEYYGKIDAEKMGQGDIESYALSLYFSAQNDKCNEVCRQALQRFPNSVALNQFYLRTLVPMERWDEILVAFRNLQQIENATLEIRDSLSYAAGLSGSGSFDEGMNLFDDLLAKSSLSNNDKTDINRLVRRFMDRRVEDYKKNGEYAQAADLYEKFVEKRRKKGILDDFVMNTYAQLYLDWGTSLNGEEKREKLMKGDQILVEAIAMSELNKENFLLRRINLVYFQLDGKAEEGLAIPVINQYEALVLSHPELDNGEKEELKLCYLYMLYYYGYSSAKDYIKAESYADKLLNLDPDNPQATAFKNARKRKR